PPDITDDVAQSISSPVHYAVRDPHRVLCCMGGGPVLGRARHHLCRGRRRIACRRPGPGALRREIPAQDEELMRPHAGTIIPAATALVVAISRPAFACPAGFGVSDS